MSTAIKCSDFRGDVPRIHRAGRNWVLLRPLVAEALQLMDRSYLTDLIRKEIATRIGDTFRKRSGDKRYIGVYVPEASVDIVENMLGDPLFIKEQASRLAAFNAARKAKTAKLREEVVAMVIPPTSAPVEPTQPSPNRIDQFADMIVERVTERVMEQVRTELTDLFKATNILAARRHDELKAEINEVSRYVERKADLRHHEILTMLKCQIAGVTGVAVTKSRGLFSSIFGRAQ